MVDWEVLAYAFLWALELVCCLSQQGKCIGSDVGGNYALIHSRTHVFGPCFLLLAFGFDCILQ